MEKINTFVMYDSFLKAGSALSGEDFKEYILKIRDYAIDGIETPSENVMINSLMEIVKPTLNRSMVRYKAAVENGKKGAEYGKLGGRPKKNTADVKTPVKPLKGDIEEQEFVNEIVLEKTPVKPLKGDCEKTPVKPLNYTYTDNYTYTKTDNLSYTENYTNIEKEKNNLVYMNDIIEKENETGFGVEEEPVEVIRRFEDITDDELFEMLMDLEYELKSDTILKIGVDNKVEMLNMLTDSNVKYNNGIFDSRFQSILQRVLLTKYGKEFPIS